MTGRGLSHWYKDESYHDHTPPANWPMLNLIADQGSDGLSGANFLQHHCRMNILFCADPCHRAWNDCKQALKRAGLWETVLGSSVLLNYPNGPWKEQRFHRRNQEVMQITSWPITTHHIGAVMKMCSSRSAVTLRVHSRGSRTKLACADGSGGQQAWQKNSPTGTHN
eukprot:2154441-Amphidinium_carterae.1